MNLRKIIPLFFIAMSFTVVTPALAAFGTPETKKTEQPADQRSQELMNRLKEIRDMDKSNLSKEEKRALKKEVRAIKREVRRSRGIIFGIGIFGIALIVLLLVWIL